LFIISVDFKEAFDRISHKILFAILHSYGFSDTFVEHIQHCMTTQPRSSKSTDMSTPFPHSVLYQTGVSVNMMFACCINPLIHRL
jgi:hypothetical protein